MIYNRLEHPFFESECQIFLWGKQTHDKHVLRVECVDFNEKTITGDYCPTAFLEAKTLLSRYLDQEEVDFSPVMDMALLSGTPFQKQVWSALKTVPYGQTISYKALGAKIGKTDGFQAIGHAVGQNPLAIMLPCHRIIGSNGQLTGYAYGLEMKKKLLCLEGVEII